MAGITQWNGGKKKKKKVVRSRGFCSICKAVGRLCRTTALRGAVAVAAVAAAATVSADVTTIPGIVVVLGVHEAVGVPVGFVWTREIEFTHLGVVFTGGVVHEE